MSDINILRANLEDVQEKIAQCALAAGRSANEIRLLPVTKYHSVEQLSLLAELGVTQMGENRVQDIQLKAEQLNSIDWVLIGHLQKNKVKAVLPLISEIQSIDSLSLAENINRRLDGTGRKLKICLQVNTSNESAKSGFSATELSESFPQLLDLENIEILGLMTMAANTPDTEIVRASFRSLRVLRDELCTQYQVSLPELSMGMSGDHQIAIEEGSTTVRVGSAIFAGLPSQK